MAVTNGCPNGPHSSRIKRVLVLGDNRIATSVLDVLSVHGPEVHHAVHKHSNETSNSSTISHPIDFSIDSIHTLFTSIQPDVVFSTTSGGSYEFQKALIDISIKANIPRFVPAEFGQDSLNEQVQNRLPPCKERARVIAYLQEQQDKLEWVAAATGVSLDQGLVSGNLGFDIKWQSVTVHGTGKERFAASSTAWLGQVALAIIQHWEEVKNQYLYVPGMITSVDEVLESLQEKTGQKWERGEVEVEETLREAERRLERGSPDAGMFLMERSVLFDEKLHAIRSFIEKDAKVELGLQEEKLDVLVKKVVHDHKHHGKGGCGCE